MSADPGDTGVDGDDVRAKLHHVDEAVAEETVAVGGQRLLAPNDNPLAQRVSGVVEAARQVTSVVELGVASAQHVVGDGAAGAVAGPAGLRVAAVRGLQHGEGQRVVVDASLTAGATEADDGLGAVGVLEVANLLADGVESLIPRGALPLHLATILVGTLHRVDDALGSVGVLAKGEVHSVNAAVGDRVVVVTLDADQLAVLDDDLDAVSNGMRSRRGPSVGAGNDGAVAHVDAPLLAVCHVFLLSTRFTQYSRNFRAMVRASPFRPFGVRGLA